MSSSVTDKRPDLPKRLAARIRGAQGKVELARFSIFCDEANNAQDQARVDEYDADPGRFSTKYYGNHTADSYPVQTNICRAREALERRALRLAPDQERLKAAEENLKIVEREVLEEVNRMCPTPGRVPWPVRLTSFEDYRATLARQWKAEYERDERERAREEEKYLIEDEALESDSNRLHEANPLISNHLHAPCTRLSYGETS